MSRIPRKKSRKIVVDNITYRWLLKGKDRFIGNTPLSFLIIIQEDAEKPGDVLEVSLVSKVLSEEACQKEKLPKNDVYKYISEWDDNYTHKASVVPSDIELIIRQGLETGWKPGIHSGQPFVLGVLNKELKDYEISNRA